MMPFPKCPSRVPFNLPFSNPAWKNVPRVRVKRRPIRHISDLFQNFPTSCEGSISHSNSYSYSDSYGFLFNSSTIVYTIF